jgi:anti-anti-sigma factor
VVDVRVKESDGLALVSLHGELDLSEVPEVDRALKGVEKHRPELLVLDLRGLEFLDSSGLRLVLEADLRSRQDSRKFAVIRGPDSVHRVFLIALLDKRLEFIDDPSTLGDIVEDRA